MIDLPHLTVAAVIEQDGRFLLVEERIDGNPVLNQPAGHLENGESLLDAVIRETREETSRDFMPSGLVGVYRWSRPGDGMTYVRFCFAGQCGEPHAEYRLDEGIEATLWLSPTEIRRQGRRLRSPLVLACIEDYLAGASHPLDLIRDIVTG